MRMTNDQAAIIEAKLDKLDTLLDELKIKMAIVTCYGELLEEIDSTQVEVDALLCQPI